MDWEAEVSHEERALEVLIGMTAKTLCRRSNSHLENALLLVEVSLGHANLHWSMLVEQHLAKKAAQAQRATEAAEAEAKKAREAAEQAAQAAEQAAQAEQQKQAGAEGASASGTAAQPAANTTEATGSAAQQSTAGDKAPEPSTTAGEDASKATAAAQVGSKTGDTAAAPGASSSGPASDAEVPIPELNQQDDPGLVIQSLPEHLLKQLARLLGQSGLSELAQKRCASVIRMLVDMSPQLKPMMLSELQNELQRWGVYTCLHTSCRHMRQLLLHCWMHDLQVSTYGLLHALRAPKHHSECYVNCTCGATKALHWVCWLKMASLCTCTYCQVSSELAVIMHISVILLLRVWILYCRI